MQEVKNDNPSLSKRPFIFYAVISFIVIMLLNALVFKLGEQKFTVGRLLVSRNKGILF